MMSIAAWDDGAVRESDGWAAVLSAVLSAEVSVLASVPVQAPTSTAVAASATGQGGRCVTSGHGVLLSGELVLSPRCGVERCRPRAGAVSAR